MDIGFGVVGCGVVLAGVGLVANNYISPITGDPTGIAYPVVILIIATLVMSYLARQRRFGRYVYAYGGNPEAAELGGINTRRTVMLTFVLMGVLVGVSAAIQTARLNAAVTNLGVQNELDVIAAAVIGGTSFAGGVGTIAGAVLGAVIMQSLRSGMVLLNIDSPVPGHRGRCRAGDRSVDRLHVAARTQAGRARRTRDRADRRGSRHPDRTGMNGRAST